MINIDSCKTCRYFDSKDWNSEDKNWCRYNDLPAINEGLCGHHEPMIKPCPICKGEVRYYEYGRIGGFGFEVECPRCHLSMTDADEDRLIERWNRRAGE